MDAVHIHVDELRDRLEELDQSKTYIAYCTVSLRGYIAYKILVNTGFKAKILIGGMETWSPVEEGIAEKRADEAARKRCNMKTAQAEVSG